MENSQNGQGLLKKMKVIQDEKSLIFKKLIELTIINDKSKILSQEKCFCPAC